MTRPESQRTCLPNFRSSNSGIVSAPDSRNGLMTKPVKPTTAMATAIRIPGVAPAKPFLKPSSAVYMAVMMPNSVAAREAMPR